MRAVRAFANYRSQRTRISPASRPCAGISASIRSRRLLIPPRRLVVVQRLVDAVVVVVAAAVVAAVDARAVAVGAGGAGGVGPCRGFRLRFRCRGISPGTRAGAAVVVAAVVVDEAAPVAARRVRTLSRAHTTSRSLLTEKSSKPSRSESRWI